MQEDSATNIYIDEWGIISAEHHISWFAISPSTVQIMQNKSKLKANCSVFLTDHEKHEISCTYCTCFKPIDWL